MSHDEPTLPERRQADVLARWLSGATDGIPDELDEDVIEAVIALRPELAPAPTLTAEDILAEVTAGPLALPPLSALAADSVPADRLAPTPPPANSRRWFTWAAAGAGGLAAIAAAALVFMSSATLNGASYGPVAKMEEARESASRPSPEVSADSAEAPTTAATEPPGVVADSNRQQKESAEADEIRVIMGAPPTPRGGMDGSDRMAKNEAEDAFDTLGTTGGGSAGQGGDGLGTGGLTRSGAEAAGGFGAGAGRPDADPVAGEFAPDADDAVADVDDLEEAMNDVPVEEELDMAPVARSPQVVENMAVSESVTASAPSRGARREENKRTMAKSKDADAPSSLKDLERAARPTGAVAAEVEALQELIGRGQAADARTSAQRLLDGGGLSDLRRADLYWVLGEAHRKLGATTPAESAYREAIRLRGR